MYVEAPKHDTQPHYVYYMAGFEGFNFWNFKILPFKAIHFDINNFVP